MIYAPVQPTFLGVTAVEVLPYGIGPALEYRSQQPGLFGVGVQDLRHRHRKEINGHIGVEGFQNISGNQRMVDPSIFVLLQPRELVRSYVDHR